MRLTDTDGMSEMRYQVTNPATGMLTLGTKTVYDPAVRSDQSMLQSAQKAREEAFGRYKADPSSTSFNVTQDGITFRTYINFDSRTGDPYVGNVHPVNRDFVGEDYFHDAFGGFFPNSDEHAAAKFALNALAMDGRIEDLVQLLTEGDPVGALGGEPSWQLDRRDDDNTATGYANWPREAKYCTWVDPNAYRLEWPWRFYGRAEFHHLVRALLDAYLARNPHEAEQVAKVAALL